MIWAALPGLTLGALHSYMDTEITDDLHVSLLSQWSDRLSDESINTKGNELNRAPHHKFTTWGNYHVPLGRRGSLDFLVTYAYTDEQYHSIINVPINEAPSFERWDARAVWDSPTKKYRIAAYVKNITDELGIIELRTAPNFGRLAETTAPRTWALEFRMRFGAWEDGGLDTLLTPDRVQ